MAIAFASIVHLVALLAKFTIGRNKLNHMKRRLSCDLGAVFLSPESA
jgi:hypothetical protein